MAGGWLAGGVGDGAGVVVIGLFLRVSWGQLRMWVKVSPGRWDVFRRQQVWPPLLGDMAALAVAVGGCEGGSEGGGGVVLVHMVARKV